MPRVTLALALVLSIGGPALAKRAPADQSEPTPVKHFDFDDDQVEAGRALPLYEVVEGRRGVRHESLVRPRTTFVPELLKSAEDR